MSDSFLRLHAEVLFLLDADSRILAINEPDPEHEAPALFVARGKDSNLVLFRHDVPDSMINKINKLVARLEFWDGLQADVSVYEQLRLSFTQWLNPADVSHGPAFRFTQINREAVNESLILGPSQAGLLSRNFPYTQSIFDERSPVASVLRDEGAVSCCYSARKSDSAAEAGVATIEQHRGQGFALDTVAHWAHAVSALGLTPLYSTSWSNPASLNVAAKLGLEAYADTWSLSPISKS